MSAFLASTSQQEFWKTALVCSAAALAALSMFETKLGLEVLRGDGTRIEGSIVDGLARSNELLGYAPAKGKRVTARKLSGDKVIYDVVYTIGPNGLRVAPPTDSSAHSECVAFFGDSITFGEGVNDRQAYPYQVGVKSGGRFEVYNFAYSGYGPHQMLAALQGGLVEGTVSCKPTRFIYLALVDHVARAAGLTSWDRHGPRFEVGADEVPVRVGHFDDATQLLGPVTVPRWVNAAFGPYFTAQRFFGHARPTRLKDLQLFLAVIHESARQIRRLYPYSEFHVILWDDRDDPRLTVIDAELRRPGVAVHRLTTIIPEFNSTRLKYALDEHDNHPNSLGHALIADYIVRIILPRTTEGSDARSHVTRTGSSRADPRH